MPRREGTAFNEWVTRHLTLALGSVTGMWLAFVVPLVAFGIPPLLKILGLVSSYWVQLWALFVLQRTANRAEQARDAKADADHTALTHVAVTADAVVDRLDPATPGGLAEVMALLRLVQQQVSAVGGAVIAATREQRGEDGQ
jgi:hypothetical protein